MTWENKWHHSKCSPSSSFPPLYPLSTCPMDWYSPWATVVTCPGCVPSYHTPSAPSPAVQGAGTALALCSAVTKTSLFYQPCVEHKAKHSPKSVTEQQAASAPAQSSTSQHTHPTAEQLCKSFQPGAELVTQPTHSAPLDPSTADGNLWMKQNT